MGLIQNIISSFKGVGEDDLIHELKDDHHTLFSIYTKIEKNIEKKNYKKVLDLMKKFHYEYKLHIIYEDNYFYTNMKKKYKMDEQKLIFIHLKQKEMTYISKAVAKFVEKYSNITEVKKESFKQDLLKLGNELKKRIAFEEKELYTLYS